MLRERTNAPGGGRLVAGHHNGGHAPGPPVVRSRSRRRPRHRRRAGSSARLGLRRRRFPPPVRHPQLHAGRWPAAATWRSSRCSTTRRRTRPCSDRSSGRGRPRAVAGSAGWSPPRTWPTSRRGLGREAVEGFRHLPDGTRLEWRQLGVRGLQSDPQLPFFVQWRSEAGIHPSVGGGAIDLFGLEIAGSQQPGRGVAGRLGGQGAGRHPDRVGRPAGPARADRGHLRHPARGRADLSRWALVEQTTRPLSAGSGPPAFRQDVRGSHRPGAERRPAT